MCPDEVHLDCPPRRVQVHPHEHSFSSVLKTYLLRWHKQWWLVLGVLRSRNVGLFQRLARDSNCYTDLRIASLQERLWRIRLVSLYLTLNCVVLFFRNPDVQGWPWLLRTSTQVPCLFSFYLLLGTFWVFHAAESYPSPFGGLMRRHQNDVVTLTLVIALFIYKKQVIRKTLTPHQSWYHKNSIIWRLLPETCWKVFCPVSDVKNQEVWRQTQTFSYSPLADFIVGSSSRRNCRGKSSCLIPASSRYVLESLLSIAEFRAPTAIKWGLLSNGPCDSDIPGV